MRDDHEGTLRRAQPVDAVGHDLQRVDVEPGIGFVEHRKPRLAVLDETDSGLDIDALKIVSEGVNRLRSPDRSMIVITHYQRLLDYIVPDVVHVLAKGRVVKSGGKELALELEAKGYAQYSDEAA
jgi:Fe-S cluster assembly ATP-binding protein